MILVILVLTIPDILLAKEKKWCQYKEGLSQNELINLEVTEEGLRLKVYREDFDDGKADDWIDPWGYFYGTEPNHEDGHNPFVYTEENDWVEGGLDIYSFFKVPLRDFTWVLEIRDGYKPKAHRYKRNHYGSSRLGLAFRIPEINKYPEEHYWLHTVPPMGLYVGWKQVKPFSKKIRINKGPKWPSWHKLRINVHESSIMAFMDDMERPLLKAQDKTFEEAGYLAIKAFHFPNYWCFDNICIYPHTGTIVTERINRDRSDIIEVKIDWEHFLPSKEQSITYYASNNGGSTWRAIPQEDIYYSFPMPGNDLRLKAELNTTNKISPVLKSWKAVYK